MDSLNIMQEQEITAGELSRIRNEESMALFLESRKQESLAFRISRNEMLAKGVSTLKELKKKNKEFR